MTKRLPRITAAVAIRALERQDSSSHGKAEATRSTRTKKEREQLSPITPARSFIQRS